MPEGEWPANPVDDREGADSDEIRVFTYRAIQHLAQRPRLKDRFRRFAAALVFLALTSAASMFLLNDGWAWGQVATLASLSILAGLVLGALVARRQRRRQSRLIEALLASERQRFVQAEARLRQDRRLEAEAARNQQLAFTEQ